MNKLASIVVFVLLSICSNTLKAQDAPLNFSIRDINDKKILITWTSTLGDSCIQLAVQRSFDSTHFFSTIYSAQSPELPQNGVVDLRMPKGVKVFYRIFYVVQGGNYFFTKSVGLYSFFKTDNINSVEKSPTKNPLREIGNIEIEPNTTPNQPSRVKHYVNIFRRTTDSLLKQIDDSEFKHLRDSIISRTKDTLFVVDENNIIIKPYTAKPAWRPSVYVNTNNPTNNVKIHLPSPKLHKYRIVFFEENGTQLFEIKPKEDNLVLDNTNFIHGGWFSFDFYEDDKLKEHNRFQIIIPF